MKNVYDNSDFFESYQTMRESQINANNLIEIPIMKKLLPNIKDKTILDLGCGDGKMDRYFVELGAKKILAIDISTNMINTALKENIYNNIDYMLLGMEDIDKIDEKFDIVYSSLAFHYVQDFNKLLNDIHHLLKPNGILIFSQENPIHTATVKVNKDFNNKTIISGKRYYLFSDYCNEGERNHYWNNIPVTKYHRTYATLVNSLIQNKFEIIKIQDSYATEDAIKLCEKYKYQQDRPLFTFVVAKKQKLNEN